MRKAVALFAILIAFTAFLTPVAMANVRALHLCCPPKQAAPQAMEHCDHDVMAPGSTASFQSEMPDCSRHMISTAAPGIVHPATRVVVGRPQASHPVLDEFVPLFATDTDQSSQQDRAPPAIGQ